VLCAPDPKGRRMARTSRGRAVVASTSCRSATAAGMLSCVLHLRNRGAAPEARKRASSQVGSAVGSTRRRSQSPKFSMPRATLPTLPASNVLARMTDGTVCCLESAVSNASTLVDEMGRSTFGPHFAVCCVAVAARLNHPSIITTRRQTCAIIREEHGSSQLHAHPYLVLKIKKALCGPHARPPAQHQPHNQVVCLDARTAHERHGQ
jgi:hypothetical protein